MRIGCVIMASGESRRFEGNKLLVPFLGEPLIVHTLRKLPYVPCEAVVVTRSEAVRAICDGEGVRCLLHEEPQQRDTIRIGLSTMAGMDGCLFLVADQPLLLTSTLSSMLEAWAQAPGAILRASFQGRFGNPVLFPAALFPELLALEPGETGGAVIRRHPGLTKEFPVASTLELMDIDTREGLAAVERLARERCLPK